MGYDVKKLTMDEYRAKIEEHGCPNCGEMVRKAQDDHEHWTKWRCPNPDCSESENWTNIWEVLESSPL